MPVATQNRETIFYVSDFKYFSRLKTDRYTSKRQMVEAHLKYISRRAELEIGDKQVILDNVDKYDKRVDSRVAVSFVVALPNGLSLQEYEEYMRELLSLVSDRLNIQEDWFYMGLHLGEGISGKENAHVHIVATPRTRDGKALRLSYEELKAFNPAIRKWLESKGWQIRTSDNPIDHIGPRMRYDNEARERYLDYLQLREEFQKTQQEVRQEVRRLREELRKEELRKRLELERPVKGKAEETLRPSPPPPKEESKVEPKASHPLREEPLRPSPPPKEEPPKEEPREKAHPLREEPPPKLIKPDTELKPEPKPEPKQEQQEQREDEDMITREQRERELDEIKRLEPEEVARHIGMELVFRGRSYYKARAPYRVDKNPSVVIYQSSTGHWIWTDLATGKKGTWIDLLMEMGYDYKEAVKELRRLAGIEKTRTAQRPEPKQEQKPEPQDKTPQTPIASQQEKKYTATFHEVERDTEEFRLLEKALRTRGYRYIPDFVKLWRVKIEQEGSQKTGYVYGILDVNGNRHVRFLYKPSEKRIYKAGSEKATVSLIKRNSNVCVVVEGIHDAIAVDHATKGKTDILILNSVAHAKDAIEILRGYQKVIIMTDNDEAGRKAGQEINSALGEKSIMIDYDWKDPDEAFRFGEFPDLSDIIEPEPPTTKEEKPQGKNERVRRHPPPRL